MDNVTRLIQQIRSAAPGLRIVDVIHEQTCVPPCRCVTRAVVLVPEPANNRRGFKLVRRLVRLDLNAPEPQVFKMPEPFGTNETIRLPKMPLISVEKVK